jgi:hypothetical protein
MKRPQLIVTIVTFSLIWILRFILLIHDDFEKFHVLISYSSSLLVCAYCGWVIYRVFTSEDEIVHHQRSKLLILIGIFILNYVFTKNGIDDNTIMHLQYKNDSLFRINQIIDSLLFLLHKELKENDYQISLLTEKDNHQKSIIEDLNTRIKTLNKKYEKANNYSNNYNNNEISSYFSNIR